MMLGMAIALSTSATNTATTSSMSENPRTVGGTKDWRDWLFWPFIHFLPRKIHGCDPHLMVCWGNQWQPAALLGITTGSSLSTAGIVTPLANCRNGDLQARIANTFGKEAARLVPKSPRKAPAIVAPEILIFDVDGVLLDVRQAYWRAGIGTIRQPNRKTVDPPGMHPLENQHR